MLYCAYLQEAKGQSSHCIRLLLERNFYPPAIVLLQAPAGSRYPKKWKENLPNLGTSRYPGVGTFEAPVGSRSAKAKLEKNFQPGTSCPSLWLTPRLRQGTAKRDLLPQKGLGTPKMLLTFAARPAGEGRRTWFERKEKGKSFPHLLRDENFSLPLHSLPKRRPLP